MESAMMHVGIKGYKKQIRVNKIAWNLSLICDYKGRGWRIEMKFVAELQLQRQGLAD